MPINPGQQHVAEIFEEPVQEKKSLVDRVIADHFMDDPQILFRARILVSSWIFFLIILMVFGPLTALLSMKDEARIGALIMTISMSLLLACMIFTFRFNGNYRLYGNLSVLLGFTGIVIAVLLSKVPTESPSLSLFYVIPLLAVFFLGMRGGIYWVGVTVMVLASVFVLELIGFEFLDIYDEQFTLETTISSVMMGFSAVLGLVITYERANKKLRDERDEEYRRLDFLAHHDLLTGLSNRMYFENEIENRIESLGLVDNHSKLVLIYIDLDGFKPINDEYGHKAGDLVLKVIAERVKGLLEGRGFAARHGGDEFILLLEGINKNEEVVVFVEMLKNSIQEEIIYERISLNVDASVGIAFFPRDAQDISTLIRKADSAMYHAKKNKLPYIFSQDI